MRAVAGGRGMCQASTELKGLGLPAAAPPQAATAPRPSGPNTPPSGGDGFTYEHLAARDEVWWDFVADTGDGGDPTYA